MKKKKRIIKAPELMKARNALIKFLKDNNLDPSKDYSKHPKHGKEYKRLMITLQIERDKLMIDYPNQDIKNRKKYYKMKKDKKKKAAAAAAESTEKVSKKAVKVEKVEKSSKKGGPKSKRPTKYDYPLIDGREMTSAEKKAYRVSQRKAANGGTSKKKDKDIKKEKKASEKKEVKKVKKSPDTKKKAKKAVKVED